MAKIQFTGTATQPQRKFFVNLIRTTVHDSQESLWFCNQEEYRTVKHRGKLVSAPHCHVTRASEKGKQ